MRLRAASLGLVVAIGNAACGEEAAGPSPSAAPDAPTGEIRRDGDNGGAGAKPPVDNGAPSTSYPAPHAEAPTVVSLGGPVLAHPRIVPVTFAGDAYAGEIGAFLHAMTTSAYWKSAVSEYGVGDAEIGETVIVDEAPSSPVDDQATAEWLIGEVDALDAIAAPPEPDAQTVYALFYPRNTLLSGTRWGKGCVDFAGYHWEVARADGSRVPYIVIPRCASWQELHGFDVVTTTASHEIVEAVTDPFPQSAPAFAGLDADHQVWRLFPFGELADMCTAAGAATTRPADLPYTVQRTWSNAAARAHHDPCGAGAKGAYFNSAPAMPDDVTIEMVTHSTQTKGVKIPLGESRTIDIDLFSDGPTRAPWTVTPRDVSSLGGRLPSLSFQLDRDTGVNGEKLHLTITAVREGQSGGAEFMLVSSLQDETGGTQTSTWFGFVANASTDPGSAPVR